MFAVVPVKARRLKMSALSSMQAACWRAYYRTGSSAYRPAVPSATQGLCSTENAYIPQTDALTPRLRGWCLVRICIPCVLPYQYLKRFARFVKYTITETPYISDLNDGVLRRSLIRVKGMMQPR